MFQTDFFFGFAKEMVCLLIKLIGKFCGGDLEDPI